MVSLDQDNLTVETRRPVNLVKVDIVGFQVFKERSQASITGHMQMIGKNFSGLVTSDKA